MVDEKNYCRICGNTDLFDFLNLGSMPPANTLIPSEALGEKEKEFPLTATACIPCAYVQLKHVVSPDTLFGHYQYMSSASHSYLAHFATLADLLIRELDLPEGSLVVDIGSNDGSLLKEFSKRNMRVLGVDPAENLAKTATADGVETLCAYFTPHVARTIKSSKGPAKLVTATNVFAHVDDLAELLDAIDSVLDRGGVFVAQFSYLGDVISKNAFDTIYHEHLSYFSIHSLQRLFFRSPLQLYKAEQIPIHGGSLRIFARKPSSPRYKGGRTRQKRSTTKPTPALQALIHKERDLKLQEKKTYTQFAARARRIKQDLRKILVSLAKEKKMVIGLGAPAKGITLINYTGLSAKHIHFITDSTPTKHGHFTPRSRIPIVPEHKLLEYNIDYAIIFAWNFAEEIIEKTKFFRGRGGKYIIPVPKVRVI